MLDFTFEEIQTAIPAWRWVKGFKTWIVVKCGETSSCGKFARRLHLIVNFIMQKVKNVFGIL